MAWMQLRVFTRTPDFADEILATHGAQAVSFLDGADTPILEPLPGETPLWPDTVTVGWFTDTTDLEPAKAALRDAMPEGDALRFETALIEDQDWVRVWLEHWPPQKFGERLWVVPREKRHEVTDVNATILLLDPGLAFGTGTHPTTALCLEWLSRADLRGKTVLDFGCGSGILAIAALLLGAERALCVDIDPQALTATRDNACVNGVEDRVVTLLPADFEPQAHDVVLANILANPLIQLSPVLAQCAKPQGALVMAGLLDRHADEVRAAYADWFDFEPDVSREGWTRLAARCRMPALIRAHRISETLLTAGQPQRVHFPALAEAGTAVVLNLAMPTSAGYLADERAIVESLGMHYVDIPVPWQAPTQQHFSQFCKVLDAHAGQKIFVHCAANKRVSVFVYLYRTQRLGVAAATAQQDLDALWSPNETWSAFIRALSPAHTA